ncbi:MAG: SMP-30/gluconolactonase/LRE family protein [Planctomycetia bacterium]|nr:SMP-30/gluconolactonase/LRE family protein [Planctomycetia bacterium]
MLFLRGESGRAQPVSCRRASRQLEVSIVGTAGKDHRDEQGNVYLTGGAIVLYSPEGKRIETIAVPESPANVTFGSADKRTLFITARTSLYAVPMRVRGQ